MKKKTEGDFLYEDDWLSDQPMRIELIFDKNQKFCMVWIG